MPLKIMSAILVLIIISGLTLLYRWRKKDRSDRMIFKSEPTIDFDLQKDIPEQFGDIDESDVTVIKKSPYDPDSVVLVVRAHLKKPYMGYELLQSLLACGLRFGQMDIFHYFESTENNDSVLFSLAAATKNGTFPINDMGPFSCGGLVLFMRLDGNKKLMSTFDLMLDTARQLIEDLGGEIFDEFQQPLTAAVIKRIREKICMVEEKSLYTADLLDNLNT